MVRRKGKKNENRLTQPEVNFAKHYIRTGNATAAAEAAGYSPGDTGLASRVLNRPRVKAAIAKKIASAFDRAEIKASDVLSASAELAYSDVRGLLDESGCVRPPGEWPDVLARCVSEMVVEELKGPDGESVGRIVKIKLWDKVKSLNLLAKHKQLISDVQVNVEIGLADRYERILAGSPAPAIPAVASSIYIDEAPKGTGQSINDAEIVDCRASSGAVSSGNTADLLPLMADSVCPAPNAHALGDETCCGQAAASDESAGDRGEGGGGGEPPPAIG